MVAGLEVGAAVRGCAPGRLSALMRLARQALQAAERPQFGVDAANLALDVQADQSNPAEGPQAVDGSVDLLSPAPIDPGSPL